MNLAQVEQDVARRLIRSALTIHGGNVREAAKALDVSPATLHRRVNALGLREWLTTSYDRSARQPQR